MGYKHTVHTYIHSSMNGLVVPTCGVTAAVGTDGPVCAHTVPTTLAHCRKRRGRGEGRERKGKGGRGREREGEGGERMVRGERV